MSAPAPLKVDTSVSARPLAEHIARAVAADAGLDPLAFPERVTVAGDWHSKEGAAKWGIRDAARAGSGVLLHTGDFGLWSDRGGELFLNAVEAYLAETGLILIFVDGNHEDHELLAQFPVSPRHGLACVRPRLYHAPRGHRWTWAGLQFLALGGATSLDRPTLTPGWDWFAQEAVGWGDAERAVAGGQADVMITHDCPDGVRIPRLGRGPRWEPEDVARAQAHRVLMRQVVDEVRPTHLFHGHYHERYTAELDLGAGLSCQVTGLDRDGSMARSQVHLDLHALAVESLARRG